MLRVNLRQTKHLNGSSRGDRSGNAGYCLVGGRIEKYSMTLLLARPICALGEAFFSAAVFLTGHNSMSTSHFDPHVLIHSGRVEGSGFTYRGLELARVTARRGSSTHPDLLDRARRGESSEERRIHPNDKHKKKTVVACGEAYEVSERAEVQIYKRYCSWRCALESFTVSGSIPIKYLPPASCCRMATGALPPLLRASFTDHLENWLQTVFEMHDLTTSSAKKPRNKSMCSFKPAQPSHDVDEEFLFPALIQKRARSQVVCFEDPQRPGRLTNRQGQEDLSVLAPTPRSACARSPTEPGRGCRPGGPCSPSPGSGMWLRQDQTSRSSVSGPRRATLSRRSDRTTTRKRGG